MGLREDKSLLVGLVFLLGLLLNTETLTLEIVTCKLLLQFNNFFQFRFFCGILFLYIQPLPLKVSAAEGSKGCEYLYFFSLEFMLWL